MQQSTQKCKSKRIYKCCFSSKTAFYSNSTTYVHLSHSLSIYFSFTLHHYLIFFCSSLSFSVLFYFFYSEPSFSFFHSFSLQTYSLLLYVSILVLKCNFYQYQYWTAASGPWWAVWSFQGCTSGHTCCCSIKWKIKPFLFIRFFRILNELYY